MTGRNLLDKLQKLTDKELSFEVEKIVYVNNDSGTSWDTYESVCDIFIDSSSKKITIG